MYDLLSADAQAATPRDVVRAPLHQHPRRHRRAQLDRSGQRAQATERATSQVPFQVTRTWPCFGDVTETTPCRWSRSSGAWKVAWQPGLIFTGLTATSTVRVTPDVPKRGRILDRAGKPLADNGSILSVGVVPGRDQGRGGAAAGALGCAGHSAGRPSSSATRAASRPGSCPSSSVRTSDRADLEPKIGSVPACRSRTSRRACTRSGRAAAHVVGYVGHPTADELRKLAADGYDESDWIGRAGIEAWGEQRLAGTRGGVDPDRRSGRARSSATIARKRRPCPGQDITLTLDSAIQTRGVRVARRQDRQRRDPRPARQQRAGAGQSSRASIRISS